MSIQIHCKYDKLVQPESLKNHPDNPNDHSEEQINHLAWLYEKFGIRIPIIVSLLSGCIVSGHGRKLAAIKAEMKEFPVVFQPFESMADEYAFIVADNGIALQAELNQARIREKIVEFGEDFDVKALGLADFDITTNDEMEFPELSSSDPDFQQRTFVLSNEQNDILNEAMKKAKKEENCEDEINQNENGNVLTAILKRYVYG